MNTQTKPQGDWQHLDEPEQRLRYHMLGALMKERAPRSVLDIGCGQGNLCSYLPESVAVYNGLDRDEEALAIASKRNPQSNFFPWSDSKFYGVWDMVVFNESLYYFDGPERAFVNGLHVMAHNGSMLVSIYKHPKLMGVNRRVLRGLPFWCARAGATIVNSVSVSNRIKTWEMFVVQRTK